MCATAWQRCARKKARAASLLRFQFCRSCSERSTPARSENLHLFVARGATRSKRKASARPLRGFARRRDCPIVQRMVAARSVQRARQRTVRLLLSSTRSSDGPEHRWLLYTRRPPSESAFRCALSASCRTKLKQTTPHLAKRCGAYRGKLSSVRGLFFCWCGREDSNLHGFHR